MILERINSEKLVWVRHRFRRLQITHATVYGIGSTAWRFLAGPVTAVLILSFFTPELQGYYYTFSSILAMQVLFELGFSNIVRYFAAHEWANLSIDQHGHIVGDFNSLSRLVSLGRASIRWYFMIGLIIAVGIGTAGYVFFSMKSYSTITWVAPWLSLSLLTGINMFLLPIWALLEGCNQVAQVYFFRMVGSVFTSLATWAAISLGAALWTPAIAVSVILLWSFLFLWWRYSAFFKSFLSKPTGAEVNWWGEIWQVQWRTAVTYLGGYFSTYIFTPVLFYFHGPVVAGQFGMSWAIVGALGGVAAMWSTPRGPQFAGMIARREFEAIDHLLYRIIIIALGVLMAGGVAGWLLIYCLKVLNHPFAMRFLSPLPMALLIVGVVVANALHPTSVYLRAHKKEPYVKLTVVLGLFTVILAPLLGSKLGAVGITSTYLLVQMIALPWGLAIFYRRRREWRYVEST